MTHMLDLNAHLAAFGALVAGHAPLLAVVPAERIVDAHSPAIEGAPSVAVDAQIVDGEPSDQGPLLSAIVAFAVEVRAPKRSEARHLASIVSELLDGAHLEPQGLRPMVLYVQAPTYSYTAEPALHRWLVTAESVAQAAAA